MADAAPVDAPKHRRSRLHLGERTGRARRKAAPSYFDNCEMVLISSFEVCCKECGIRASYEIRPAPNGKGRVVVCDQVLDRGVEYTVAEARAAHSNQCAALEVNGMDFRTLATLAGKAYLVVGKPSTVAAGAPAGPESLELFPVAVVDGEKPL